MKPLFASVFLLAFAGACSSTQERPFSFQLQIKKPYINRALSTFIQDNKLDKKHNILQVVFSKTLTHQYTYISPSSLKPNYGSFQPEGWLVVDGIFIIVCESGEFYKRVPAVEAEIEHQMAALQIQLERNEGAIVEPGGQRVIYCSSTGSIQLDHDFLKVHDEECR